MEQEHGLTFQEPEYEQLKLEEDPRPGRVDRGEPDLPEPDESADDLSDGDEDDDRDGD